MAVIGALQISTSSPSIVEKAKAYCLISPDLQKSTLNHMNVKQTITKRLVIGSAIRCQGSLPDLRVSSFHVKVELPKHFDRKQ